LFAVLILTILILLVSSAAVFGQEEGTTDQASGERSPLAIGLLALGASLAIAGTAIATGIAQSRIGAAGAGTIAERPEAAGTIIILIAIPETMVILGFIISVIILFTL